MSNLKKPIDFGDLEEELKVALKADELYQLQNDTKIRAIEQRVPTYEHFRNMVEAAHLRPLERAEMNNKVEVSWNHCLIRNKEDLDSKCPSMNSKQISTGETAQHNISAETLTNSFEKFQKIWKSFDNPTEKCEFLYNNRSRLKDKIFKIEIPCSLLEEIIGTLATAEVNTEKMIELLDIFSICNRFSLNLSMINSRAKIHCKKLFEHLSSMGEEDTGYRSRIDILSKSYAINM